MGSNFDPTSSDFLGGHGYLADTFNLGGRPGGKGGKSEMPGSPDFGSIAREQADYSREAAAEQTRQNRPDQYGPFGSSEWTQGPDGRWSQQTSLAPGLQTTADALMSQLSGNAQINPSQARDQAIEGAYGMQTSRLDPRFAAARGSRETQLANEGFTRGDEGWRTAMDEFSRGENDAYQQALLSSQSGAGNTAFAQSLAANMQPYQQLGQISGLSRQPSFIPAGQADVPQLLAAAMQQYGSGLDAYNAQQAGKNSKMQGGATLGGAAIAASDERLKTEIERLSVEAIPGVPFARWRWKDTGDVGFGVVAQDLEKVRPDLVVEIGGIKHVRYGGLH